MSGKQYLHEVGQMQVNFVSRKKWEFVKYLIRGNEVEQNDILFGCVHYDCGETKLKISIKTLPAWTAVCQIRS